MSEVCSRLFTTLTVIGLQHGAGSILSLVLT